MSHESPSPPKIIVRHFSCHLNLPSFVHPKQKPRQQVSPKNLHRAVKFAKELRSFEASKNHSSMRFSPSQEKWGLKSQESGGLDWNFQGKANLLFFKSSLVYITNFPQKQESFFLLRTEIYVRWSGLLLGCCLFSGVAMLVWERLNILEDSRSYSSIFYRETSYDDWNVKISLRKNQKPFYILLMVQKTGVHQLRLVVYPVIYQVLYIPSGAGFLLSSSALCGFPTFERVKQKTCHMESFNWFRDRGPLEFNQPHIRLVTG